jgi:hypothetical protein
MELVSNRKPELDEARAGGPGRYPLPGQRQRSREREPRGLFSMEAATMFPAPFADDPHASFFFLPRSRGAPD